MAAAVRVLAGDVSAIQETLDALRGAMEGVEGQLGTQSSYQVYLILVLLRLNKLFDVQGAPPWEELAQIPREYMQSVLNAGENMLEQLLARSANNMPWDIKPEMMEPFLRRPAPIPRAPIPRTQPTPMPETKPAPTRAPPARAPPAPVAGPSGLSRKDKDSAARSDGSASSSEEEEDDVDAEADPEPGAGIPEGADPGWPPHRPKRKDGGPKEPEAGKK